jgi:LacI family repressor for deo operon, udp, cdd, tsx, nupC, and nupG
MMATIEDVAAMAGVSIATVSRVMNNSYIVSQEKREKVLSAAKTLNYQANKGPARHAESKVILIAGSEFVYDIITGMQDKARDNGFEIVFCYCSNQLTTLKTSSLLNRGLIDGIVLLNYFGRDDEINELMRQYPIVQCGDSQTYPNGFTVSINNEQAACDVVNHLVGLGRRRIAFARPKITDCPPNYLIEREKGYRLALSEHGIPFDPALLFQSDMSPDNIVDMSMQILALADRPDAVFSVSDTLAAGCLITLRNAGINVPKSIAIAGFDNFEISELCKPVLTTINQPLYEIGCECIRLLLSLIKEENSIGRHVMLDHELVVRASTIGEAACGTARPV